jgi:hypothetical protein
VAAGVVANGGADLLRHRVQAGEDRLDRIVSPFGALERLVGVVHVRLMVFVVVDPHRLLVDVRLERAVLVRKRG